VLACHPLRKREVPGSMRGPSSACTCARRFHRPRGFSCPRRGGPEDVPAHQEPASMPRRQTSESPAGRALTRSTAASRAHQPPRHPEGTCVGAGRRAT
jgi:hypothetical protein